MRLPSERTVKCLYCEKVEVLSWERYQNLCNASQVASQMRGELPWDGRTVVCDTCERELDRQGVDA